MVMQTKRDRESNGLCCNYHPDGGVVATGYIKKIENHILMTLSHCFFSAVPLTVDVSVTPPWQDKRRPREVLEGAQDSAQLVPPVPIHPAPLCVHAPDRGAAPPQENPRVPHLQKHPRTPQNLLLFRRRGVGDLTN